MSASLELLQQAHRQGKLAHAYVVEGDPGGVAREFALDVACWLMGEELTDESARARLDQRLRDGLHPDLILLEPQSKSRAILADQIDGVLKRLSQTSFEGGWKICVVQHADRMNPSASNKFLKTLEEPPAQSLMLLLSEAPHALLPTIRSRCQHLRLPLQVAGQSPLCQALLPILKRGPAPDNLQRLARAQALREIFDQHRASAEVRIKEELSEDAEEDAAADVNDKVVEARVSAEIKKLGRELMTIYQAWHRDLYLLRHSEVEAHLLHFPEEHATLQPLARAYRPAQLTQALRSAEQMAGRLERNLPPAEVFESGWV